MERKVTISRLIRWFERPEQAPEWLGSLSYRVLTRTGYEYRSRIPQPMEASMYVQEFVFSDVRSPRMFVLRMDRGQVSMQEEIIIQVATPKLVIVA